jgi:hypothetical protein
VPLVLSELEKEFAARPLVSPYALELAIAVVSDAFRRANKAAPPPGLWGELRQRYPARFAEQLGMLAHLLASTSLAAATVEAVGATALEPAAGIAVFFEQIEPLSAEMIRGNVFRREELVRKWLGAFGGGIAGETGEQSAARINALDYRATVAEYAKAEAARKAEASERARLLREAEEREAAARGWRE